MLVFLALNGIELSHSQKELSDVILGVASDKISFEELMEWVIEHKVQY